MIETKHTSGPWSYEGGDNSSCEVNAGSTTISIPRWDKNTGVCVIDRDEMEANAKLISAAPDLLKALKIAHRYMEVFMIRDEEPLVGENLKTDSYTVLEAIKKATISDRELADKELPFKTTEQK